MSQGGPVSAVVEADVRSWVRRHGIVLWLDSDAHYTSLVDRLRVERDAGRLPYAVHAWRGSHLDLLLALEHAASGVEMPQLVVHLPGFNEESIRLTPLFELYAAGVRYRKALDTAVTEAAAGRVVPARISAFRASGELTLERADSWLGALLADDGTGLGTLLRGMAPTAVLDDLLSQAGFVSSQLGDSAHEDALWEQLAAWTGLDATWRGLALPPGRPRAADFAFTATSWALAVEYVHDLRRPPIDALLKPMTELPKPVVETCRQLAAHLRLRHATFYERTADETEGWIAEEVEAARAADLGQVDTFRFEEERVLTAALDALSDDGWAGVSEWAKVRLADGSFWASTDPARRCAWQLVDAASRLGAALGAAGTDLRGGSLEGAVNRYTTAGAKVDQAHRHLEQRRVALLYPQLPHFERLRDRLDHMRELWRCWADQWAKEFNALCKEHGFLPPTHLQQRTLFDEVVRPLAQEQGCTAYFLVDALRFEMGVELAGALEGTPAATVALAARMAELPTITAVGMNVLAPVAQLGRLRPVISDAGIEGFHTGEFRVFDPETRRRAMHDRVGGATCPRLTLSEVVSRDAASLKQSVSRARLVVVYSQEIDKAGENGVGPAVFDQILQKLRAAWSMLREAGVRRFVFTADHGFLLLDDSSREVVHHGRKVDPKRRHVLSPVPADHTDETRVPLAELAYENVDGNLMFPTSTAVFDVGKRTLSFVHGGNSLQERVIPVLSVVHRSGPGGDTMRYRVSATAGPSQAGMHCIRGRVEVVAQEALPFTGSREIELVMGPLAGETAEVEICEARGAARVVASSIVATVGADFELYFRLQSGQERVRLELFQAAGTADVERGVVDQWFAVTGARAALPTIAAVPESWLDGIEDAGIRQVFQHLAAHGTVTESEAQTMLGGQRALRRFSLHFEEHVARAPFSVRIDVVAGVKRYVREGRDP